MIKGLLVAVIFLILCAAAIAKLLYPSLVLKDLYVAAGILELILAGALVLFSHRWETWALLALVFTAWGGYALYGTIFGLPCSCMGSALALPRGVSLGANIFIVGTSWAFLREITLRASQWLISLSTALFMSGFASANILYNVNF